MTVFACCTAEAYDLSALRAALIHSPTFTALPDLALDVVYARALPATSSPPKAAATRLTEYGSSAPMTAADDDGGELFAFADGSFVAWGANAQALGARFLSEVVRKPTVGGGSRRRPVEIGASAEVEVEVMDYIEDPNEVTGLTGDTIQIGADPPPALSKLAFSHGLSRSVKIAVLEALLDRYLEPTRHVPALLAQGQKLKLSRTEILQQIGELLSVRALLNLAGGPNTESLLDTPEYYWSKPQLEEYYNKVCRWLDVKPRISVLNQKLDYAAEFAQVLRGHLSEQHSLKLEWFIIILIAIEVVFGLCEWGEKLGYLEFNTASHHVAVHGPNEPGPVAAGAHIGSNNHGGHCCSCQCAAHPATVSQEKV
ncbi:hypothetical protein BC828DRAFT_377278 [Blastocladiella britannica]|nr:hypothetical protein BC828DRAFT_377278 [Blastocladiella britannica]